jgi:beta-lactamase superfamily II metal-dependent hydrolase
MLRAIVLFITVAAICAAQPRPQGTPQARTLDIYWIDVEGGAATLIVSPSGESLLVDTGFPGNDDRDAKRIALAAVTAGLTRIDNLVITHFHVDHIGGAEALSKLIPIRRFIDHGDSIEATGRGAQIISDYRALTEGKRTIVKPGDKIALAGVDITVVSAAGKVLANRLDRGFSTSFCEGAQTKPADTTENGQSTGFLLTYNRFSFLDVGDLTWDHEMELACPVNKIGEVSLFQATHHGFSNGQSGATALINSLKPQVVIVNNGARKGFSNGGYESIKNIPGIEGIWQGHRGEANDPAMNTQEDMIANLSGAAGEDKGYWIKASVAANGSFTVTNSRNNFSKTYNAR